MKGFTPKAVEAIQSILGIALTQEQIDRGAVKFEIESRWSWKNSKKHPAQAIIGKNLFGKGYHLQVTQYPDPLPAYTDFYQTADNLTQLKKACEALKNY